MNLTLIVPIVSFVAVAGVVGLLAFVFRDNTPKSNARLDVLIGKKRKDDGSADILKKSAFESDKRSLMALLAPKIPSLEKLFEQAEANIKPGALFAAAGLLAVGGMTLSWLAHVPWFLAPWQGW